MKKNRLLKQMLTYVIKNDRTNLIWHIGVLKRGIFPVILIKCLLGLLFGELRQDPALFLMNSIMAVVLIIPIGILQGYLEFDFYKTILKEVKWNRKLIWQYIIMEGVLGWGMLLAISIEPLYPFEGIKFLMNVAIWGICGIGFGAIMRHLLDLNKLKKVADEVREKLCCNQ